MKEYYDDYIISRESLLRLLKDHIIVSALDRSEAIRELDRIGDFDYLAHALLDGFDGVEED